MSTLISATQDSYATEDLEFLTQEIKLQEISVLLDTTALEDVEIWLIFQSPVLMDFTTQSQLLKLSSRVSNACQGPIVPLLEVLIQQDFVKKAIGAQKDQERDIKQLQQEKQTLDIMRQ